MSLQLDIALNNKIFHAIVAIYNHEYGMGELSDLRPPQYTSHQGIEYFLQ